jgi:sulfur carrier protein ThiS adenylyltransferase
LEEAVVTESPLKFAKDFFSRRDPAVLDALRRSTVGIAGAGGLGSNVAISLARAGVGRLVIADFDTVEPSNLNRQQYFVDQVGLVKVEALRENLLRINPFSVYEVHNVRITRKNATEIFRSVDVLVEAFDKAGAKEMLIEACLGRFPGRPIVAASGLAGHGKNRKLHTRRMGNLYICGDEESQCPKGVSPMAPRVGLVANMQANLVVELLVKMRGHHVKGQ